LIIQFERTSGELFTIRADLGTAFSCLSFPEKFERSKRNNIDLFGDLAGNQVTEVKFWHLERIIEIGFADEWKLIFKMFGIRSNIILFRQNKCIRIFKNSLKNDLQFNPSGRSTEAGLSFDDFLGVNCNLKKFLPPFDSQVISQLQAEGYDGLGPEGKFRMVMNFHQKLESAENWYIDLDGPLPVFTLFKPHGTNKSFISVATALNQFYQEGIYARNLAVEKSEALAMIRSGLEKASKYIEISGAKLREMDSGELMRQIGDIIMAHLTLIPPGAGSVELDNFYTGGKITIILKPGLSPQKNAENYYRKSRNRKIEIENLRDTVNRKIRETGQLREKARAIENITDLKALRKFLGKTEAEELALRPARTEFRQFNYQGFEILVGKNAKNNDILTFGSGSKDDLWLHAKDAAGSHVVVRKKGKENIPEPVVKRAAELAAYFSRYRNSTNCPVIITQRKFVRKLKGGNPGQVLVEREKVIFVNPVF
jgi:predicted ribosome quality control (RQC) complex YloA/Tae2 family protein